VGLIREEAQLADGRSRMRDRPARDPQTRIGFRAALEPNRVRRGVDFLRGCAGAVAGRQLGRVIDSFFLPSPARITVALQELIASGRSFPPSRRIAPRIGLGWLNRPSPRDPGRPDRTVLARPLRRPALISALFRFQDRAGCRC